MTPAELERANLLDAPGTILSSAAGVVYFLIFEEGIGPAGTDAQITSWIEARRQGAVLGIARNGDAVGVAFKVSSGAQKTVQSAFVGLDDAPGLGRANLALRFVVKGTDPRTLGDYVGAGAKTEEIDDGVGAIVGRTLHEVGQALPDPKTLLSGAVVVVVLVALIVIVPRLFPSKA